MLNAHAEILQSAVEEPVPQADEARTVRYRDSSPASTAGSSCSGIRINRAQPDVPPAATLTFVDEGEGSDADIDENDYDVQEATVAAEVGAAATATATITPDAYQSFAEDDTIASAAKVTMGSLLKAVGAKSLRGEMKSADKDSTEPPVYKVAGKGVPSTALQ